MSRLALTPTNVPALASAPTLPTLRAGDLYYNTITSDLQVYNGTSWDSIAPTTTEVDGGVFDSIAPYQGGGAITVTYANTFNGGTP
tara:strand:+ start:134 stop:391 length:258 start_codon:yes stop_codon:yes gene_type:complete